MKNNVVKIDTSRKRRNQNALGTILGPDEISNITTKDVASIWANRMVDELKESLKEKDENIDFNDPCLDRLSNGLFLLTRLLALVHFGETSKDIENLRKYINTEISISVTTRNK